MSVQRGCLPPNEKMQTSGKRKNMGDSESISTFIEEQADKMNELAAVLKLSTPAFAKLVLAQVLANLNDCDPEETAKEEDDEANLQYAGKDMKDKVQDKEETFRSRPSTSGYLTSPMEGSADEPWPSDESRHKSGTSVRNTPKRKRKKLLPLRREVICVKCTAGCHDDLTAPLAEDMNALRQQGRVGTIEVARSMSAEEVSSCITHCFAKFFPKGTSEFHLLKMKPVNKSLQRLTDLNSCDGEEVLKASDQGPIYICSPLEPNIRSNVGLLDEHSAPYTVCAHCSSLTQDQQKCDQCGTKLSETNTTDLTMVISTNPVTVKEEPQSPSSSPPRKHSPMFDSRKVSPSPLVSDGSGEVSEPIHTVKTEFLSDNIFMEDSTLSAAGGSQTSMPVVLTPRGDLRASDSAPSSLPVPGPSGMPQPLSGQPTNMHMGITLEVEQVRAGSCRLMSDTKVTIAGDRVVIAHPDRTGSPLRMEAKHIMFCKAHLGVVHPVLFVALDTASIRKIQMTYGVAEEDFSEKDALEKNRYIAVFPKSLTWREGELIQACFKVMKAKSRSHFFPIDMGTAIDILYGRNTRTGGKQIGSGKRTQPKKTTFLSGSKDKLKESMYTDSEPFLVIQPRNPLYTCYTVPPHISQETVNVCKGVCLDCRLVQVGSLTCESDQPVVLKVHQGSQLVIQFEVKGPFRYDQPRAFEVYEDELKCCVIFCGTVNAMLLSSTPAFAERVRRDLDLKLGPGLMTYDVNSEDERQRYLILYLRKMTGKQKENLKRLKQESLQSSKVLLSDSDPHEVLKATFGVNDSTLTFLMTGSSANSSMLSAQSPVSRPSAPMYNNLKTKKHNPKGQGKLTLARSPSKKACKTVICMVKPSTGRGGIMPVPSAYKLAKLSDEGLVSNVALDAKMTAEEVREAIKERFQHLSPDKDFTFQYLQMKLGSKSLGPPNVGASFIYNGDGVLVLIGQGKLYIQTDLDLASPHLDEWSAPMDPNVVVSTSLPNISGEELPFRQEDDQDPQNVSPESMSPSSFDEDNVNEPSIPILSTLKSKKHTPKAQGKITPVLKTVICMVRPSTFRGAVPVPSASKLAELSNVGLVSTVSLNTRMADEDVREAISARFQHLFPDQDFTFQYLQIKPGSKSLGPPDMGSSFVLNGEGVLFLTGVGKLYIKTDLNLASPLAEEWSASMDPSLDVSTALQNVSEEDLPFVQEEDQGPEMASSESSFNDVLNESCSTEEGSSRPKKKCKNKCSTKEGHNTCTPVVSAKESIKKKTEIIKNSKSGRVNKANINCCIPRCSRIGYVVENGQKVSVHRNIQRCVRDIFEIMTF